MSGGPSIDDYSGEFWRKAKLASNDLHLARLARPQDEEVGVYRYGLCDADGNEQGEALYAIAIEPGEIIWIDGGRKLRVLDVVPRATPRNAYPDVMSHSNRRVPPPFR